MAFAVSGKVGIPSTSLTTRIEWMLSVANSIDRPKSIPQLLCYRTLKCFKIYVFKLNISTMRFSSFLFTYVFHLHIISIYFRLYVFKFQLTVKQYLHVHALHYTTVVVSGRVGIPLTGLTTAVG